MKRKDIIKSSLAKREAYLALVLLSGLTLPMMAADDDKDSGRIWEKDHYAEEAVNDWDKLREVLAASKRVKDPFGGVMDPSTIKEVVAPVVVEQKKKVVVVKKVASLQEAVEKFQVSGVFPSRQMVMGTFGSLKRGEMVEIDHDGELFKLRIQKITTDSVVFLNTKNQETATVRLGVLKGIGTRGGPNLGIKRTPKKTGPVRIE